MGEWIDEVIVNVWEEGDILVDLVMCGIDVRGGMCVVRIEKGKKEEVVGDKSRDEMLGEYKEGVMEGGVM